MKNMPKCANGCADKLEIASIIERSKKHLLTNFLQQITRRLPGDALQFQESYRKPI